MIAGYIKLYHKFLETSFYKYPNCAHLALHLLLSANWQDNKTIWNGKEMTIKRGQLITGRIALSLDTGISERSIRTCLSLLEQVGFITRISTNRMTIITICKYNEYQAIPTSKTTSQRPANDQPATTIEDVKEVKEVKITPMPFSEIWAKYPKAIGKKAALRHFNASVKNESDWTNINKALDNYLKSDNVKKGFIQNGSTWFNDWESWINKVEVKVW